jgi:acid phosphatase (class A)
MNRNRHRVCVRPVALLLLLVGLEPAAADQSCPDPAVPVAALLMPPPKHDSAQTKAELQELLRLQESRNSQQVEHVRGDDHRTVERFLGGMSIKVGQLSDAAIHLFDCIGAAVEKAVRDAKTTFMRTRPYRLHENKLHTLKKLSDRDSTSYPSGHATYGTVVGLVLVEMLPEKKGEI